jgi:hypothetical protein
MRKTRRYYKGAQQQTFERSETVRLATDENLLKRFGIIACAGDREPRRRA